MLTARHVDQFVEEGFVRLDNAFPRAIADAGMAALWQAVGCDPHDRTTWTRPVVRVCPENDWRGDQPISFRDAVNTPVLFDAFDKLVGPGRWKPRPNVGMFVVRFPSSADPGDLGWHIDASIPPESGDFDGRHHGDRDYSQWRVNLTSRGRALLMLFLFSDVTEDDAPTRVRVGSHHDVARLLAPLGERPTVPPPLTHVGAQRPVALATGEAGTVYLCHPFLVHAGQPHRGRTPRFMSQPPLEPATDFRLERDDGRYSPVESAIRVALDIR
jgi:hypothetical protein